LKQNFFIWKVTPCPRTNHALHFEPSTDCYLGDCPSFYRHLHHCRDLGEPFDFLTWFEFAPEHEPAFDELLARLRATEEWRYVDREVEVRLSRREVSGFLATRSD